MSISLVVNTRNEAETITRCLKSARPFVDEIVIVDMESDDSTVELAQKFTHKIYSHKRIAYVEPARNFAISKASHNWILLLDADEVVPEKLGRELKKLVQQEEYSFYRIPRRNLVFGKWLSHSGWWPDYQIRLFKKEAVFWREEIHSVPTTRGRGKDLPIDESGAIQHFHYDRITQYLERLNRYTSQEATQLKKEGIHFQWQHMVSKPTAEFLRRFFAWEGYKDGVHGLVLSFLQAFSVFIVELKLWEEEKFKVISKPQFLEESGQLFNKSKKEFYYWYFREAAKKANPLSQLVYKIRAKLAI